MFTILLIILIILLLGALPTWPYSRGWGYGPTGLISLILLVIVVMILANILAFWTVEVKSDDNKTTIKIEKQDY